MSTTSLTHRQLNVILCASGFLIFFIFYLASMPQTVALEDDGLFILSSYYNGVSHPPGYPLHSFLGYLISQIPIGTIASRIHALSALFGAVSCVLVGILSFILFKKLPEAILASIFVAVGSGFWSQSIIAEVYTLNTLLFLSMFIVLALSQNKTTYNNDNNLVSSQQKYSARYSFIIFLLIGLGLSNHWPLYILACAGLIFYVVPLRSMFFTNYKTALAGLLLGISPVIWLVINSNSNTFINFLGPIDSISTFSEFISRDNYNRKLHFNTNANIYDKLLYIKYSFVLLFTEHGPIAGVALVLGLFNIYKKYSRKTLLTLVLCVFGTPILLSAIMQYEYNPLFKTLYPPYFLVSYAFAGIFAAFGISFLASKIPTNKNTFMLIILSLLITLPSIAVNGLKNFRSNYNWGEEYAKTILYSLEPNSVLFVSSDITTSTLSYTRYVLGHRPDVEIIQDNGLVLGTRLFDPRTKTPAERKEIIINFTKTSDRPVYFTYKPKGIGLKNDWLVYRYNKELPANKEQISFNPKYRNFLQRVFSDELLHDSWTLLHRDQLQQQALPYLFVQLKYMKNIDVRENLITLIKSTFSDMKGLVSSIYLANQFELVDEIGGQQYLDQLADSIYAVELDREKKSVLLNLRGYQLLATGNKAGAFAKYKLSYTTWKNLDNPAVQKISQLCSDSIQDRICTNKIIKQNKVNTTSKEKLNEH